MSLALIFVSSLAIAEEYSALWGEGGELWNTNGRLRDFADVGYMNGDVPIPDWPVGVTVTNFGAVADDEIDDSQAFMDAIAACPSNHAVFAPNGRYTLEQQITVTNKNDFVLQGEDMYETVLWMPYYLTEISNAVNNAFFYVAGGSHRSIENFSFIFRDQPKGNHWENLGADAIQYHGVDDSWIRNIYIKNSDHAIGISSMWSKHISILNIVLDQYIGRSDMEGTGSDGHMGITVFDGGYHLIDNVRITGKWHHDVNAQGGKNCVWSRIRGPSLGLDHHAMGSTGNLWTDIDIGLGSGWNRADSISETYWNIRAEFDQLYKDPSDHNVFVGCQTSEPTDTGTNYWHESIDPDGLFPTNIYFAQMEKAGKLLPVGIHLTLPPAESPYRLLAVDDAGVENGNSSTNNYGLSGKVTLKNGSGTTDRQGFMKFDLRELGPTNVVCAKLRLYLNGLTAPPFGLRVMEVSDDSWSELSLTYSNMPAAGSVLTTTNLYGGGRVDLDITSYVNNELAGDQTVSLKSKGGAEGHNKDSFTSINSEEGGNSAELVLYMDESKVGPPAQPTGLAAVPSDNLIRLDWNDNTDGDLASYSPYRSTPDNSNYVMRAMGLISSDYADIGVTNGGTYTYLVKAVDTGGIESLQGDEVISIPAPLTNQPPAFTSGLIVETNAAENTQYSSTLADDASDPESDPMIFSWVSGPDWLSVSADGGLSGIPGLNDTGTNTFIIRVVAAGGSDTATLRITVNVDPLAPPAAPTGLAAVSGNHSVALDWADNGEGDLAGYSVYRATTSGSYGSALATNLTSSDYIDSAALNGITYFYVVTAIDTNSIESALSSEASATAGQIVFGTFFTGGRTRNETDWSNGFPGALNPGAISADGVVDGNSGFYVTQNGFVMNNPYGSCGFNNGECTLNEGQLSAQSLSTSGHLLTINGGSFLSTSGGGDITLGSTLASTVIVTGGSIATLDNLFVKNGSTVNVSGGTVSVTNSFTIQDNSELTVSGGILDVGGMLGRGSFYTGTAGTMFFNGGTVTAGSLNSSTKPSSPIAFVFGGDSTGSLTVSGFNGSSGNRNMDWLTGTKMSVTLTNADEWAEAEWNAGRLTYNGDDYTTLGAWATVTALGGLGGGANSEYHSVTETLSLITPLSPAALYSQWVGLYPSLGPSTNRNDDFEPDGVINWVEYALGGNPVSNDAPDILPEWSIGSDGGSNWLIYTYDRRDDAAARGLTYTVWSGTNLVDDLSNAVPAWSVSPATNGFENATHRISTDDEPNAFMQLEIGVSE